MRYFTQCIFLIILSHLLFFNCKESSSSEENFDEESVNFMVSSDYFFKNFYSGDTNPSYLLILSYSSFDSLFGVAATWDMNYSKLITEEKMEISSQTF